MNFTREPILETVITPRETFKLLLRNSKNPNQEEYLVDAVEVVSFGKALFFRSIERPDSFLVPVSDYAMVEIKETKMVLKSANPEKIKIAGGKENEGDRLDNKRKKRHRRQRMDQNEQGVVEEKLEDRAVASRVVRAFIPPPSTLIKEHLHRYKSEESVEEQIFPPVEPVEVPPEAPAAEE